MKLNKILMALAATAIVGCTSDDLNELTSKQAAEDSRLIELNENFVLSGVGVEGVATRTHWEQDATTKALVNKFLPIYNDAAAASALLSKGANLEAQAVGLCWLGQVPGAEVYTNYQFYHFGWLKKGETKANVECDKLTNGVFYDEITLANAGTKDKEAVETNFTLPSAPVDKTGWTLNYNSGVYKTDNKSIFGGKYIVYYPFNPDFKEAGTIPAKAVTSFEWDATPTTGDTYQSAWLGDATFRYSAPVTIEGGYQAADFGLYNLSTLVRLRVSTVAGDASINKDIDQIVLWSESGKLLKQANLAADKIVAGKQGQELYAETEGTKTITTNFITTVPKLNVKASTKVSAYITVLPTTVDDLVVLVHNSTDGKWAKVEMPATEFKAGNAQVLDITVKAADFKADYIAVDETSLTKALGEANTAATATTPHTPQTITVIGDITIGKDITTPLTYDISTATYAGSKSITIKGDDIIVPQDVTLNLETNLESDLRVLGKSCCTGAKGGRVDVQGGKLNNVTMEKTEAKTSNDNNNPEVKYSAAAEIVAGKTIDVQAGKVIVNAAVQHKGNIKIAKDAKLDVNAGGDLNFMGSTVTNDGTIEVMKNGKYDMTDANGNATATDGQRMTNNGKFIHNVDAGVGTAVQSMAQNGEYRCKVDDQIKLDDAFLQWTACSVIEMVNTGAKSYNLGTAAGITPEAYKHNGKYIDIEVNSGAVTTFNNPTPDDKVIQIGNLTVTKGGLDIDYTNKVGTTTGKRTLTVNGDMAVKANTNIVDSKKINVTKNLTVEGTGVKLDYKGGKKNEDGFAITKDVTVSGATFAAGVDAATATVDEVDALNITCANFYLKKGATAIFGNRTDGAAKNLVVSGTIDNPSGCTFTIAAAGQYSGSVLAWVTCKELKVGGTFSAARPRVE